MKHIDNVHVPDGFIISTDAYRQICSGEMLARVQALDANLTEPERSRQAERIRRAIQNCPMPERLLQELDAVLSQYPSDMLFAVRSSATAEDLPHASFAGQQDSYLNVCAKEVPTAVMRCFASLYNDHAVSYRVKNGFRHEDVTIAVVVQEMIASQVSGVLFTADPMTSDRYTCVVEAVEGLGEDLVSGRRIPFTWKIRNNMVKPESAGIPPLTESQLRELITLGKQIEKAFGVPQDIEWCFLDGQFSVVQARAITTLFPTPASKDGFKRFFVSAGHMQMMTDVMLPLGISFMKRIALFQMVECGGRLFIDITHDMKTVYGKKMIRTKLAAMDPLTYAATEEVMKRKAYISSIPRGPGSFSNFSNWLPMVREGIRIYRNNDPTDIDVYIKRMETSVETLKQTLAPLKGEAVIQAIIEDQKHLSDILYDATGFGMVLAAQLMIQKIDKLGKQLTGEEYFSNRLSKSVQHNPSSEMGLALNEVADLVREEPAVSAYLEQAGNDFSVEKLRELSGTVTDAFVEFLGKYGMRATGEIDISKSRFRENPATLINTILTNIRTLPKGYGETSFLKGRKEMELLTENIVSLAEQKFGRRKAKKLRRYISVFRNFVGAREYPKYFWMCRYDAYKKAIQQEAERLVADGILRASGDIYYLYWEEVLPAIHTGTVDYAQINQRKEVYRHYAVLTPPRLIFSDGEVPEMAYHKADVPQGALEGLGVSGGVVEGRARIIDSMKDAVMEQGDILVTTYTDPSWTPVFVSIAGLVTEVGGMMTHGAVITREYGLPAVVGVMDATRKIQDGDRIRVNGDKGYVTILH